jgi:hypothetical protein
MKTLIVGCSFVANICVDTPGDLVPRINQQRFDARGTSGAGNQSIAARVIYECSLQQYQQVVVLWSGINRLDYPIGVHLHDVQPCDFDGNKLYPYYTEMGRMAWYHSGGYRLGYEGDTCPDFLKNWFTQQYKSGGRRYFSELTLMSIIQTQGFLKSINMPCQMSFIYDVHSDYSKTAIEPGCGQIVTSSPLYKLVDWNQFTAQIPPYEFAQSRNELADEFHPRFATMIEWFKTQLDIDLIS